MARADACEPIDLANETDFPLGRMQVRPSLREIAIGGRSEALEPRVMQVLVALAQRRGETVSRDTLFDRCWEGRVVGDDAMNRCISRLRRLAGEGGFAIEAIPRVGYRLTEETTAAANETAISWYRRRALLIAAIAAPAMLLLAGMLIWLLQPAPKVLAIRGAAPERVAVLPFETFGADTDTRVFGKALAEQIVAVLGDRQVLAVAPKRGGAAAADYVLDGSIQRDASGLHAIVHISRTATGTTLWTGQFDQQADDVPGLQVRVAARTVDQVDAALRARRSDPAVGDAALAAYLAAQENARIGGQEATMKRRDMMRKVVAQAPTFSLGRSGLALSSAQLATFVDASEASALRREAEREAKRALALDPANGEAYLALSILAESLVEEEALCRKGLKVEPDEPTLNSNLAALLDDVGRSGEALALQRRSVMLDPLSPRKNSALAQMQARSGNTSAAIATADRAFAMNPNNSAVWSTRLFILIAAGRIVEGRALLDQVEQNDRSIPPAAFAVLRRYLEATESGTAQAKAAAIRAIDTALANGALERAVWLAEIAARLGDVDTAYAILEATYFPGGKTVTLKNHYGPDTTSVMQPALAALRADPRFLPLAERLGLMDYWRESKGPDFCDRENIPLCRALAGAKETGRTR